jgi:hypothetical protein
MQTIVRTIQACVGETVEIQWLRPGVVPIEKLIERHTAPPVHTWSAIEAARQRAAQPLIEDEWTPGGNQGVGL